MTEIALLIAANLASEAPDRRSDAHLFDVQLDILGRGFAPHGLELTPVKWTDPGVDWTRFGAVLVNTAWDYQDRHEEFLGALDRIAGLGVPVFNDPATVRWNIRKTYLREIEAKGVAVIPTLWPETPTMADIAEAMRVFGADDVVLKRQVGGGARAQVRYSRGDLAAAEMSASIMATPVMDRPGMIQPFVPAIASEGEFSFLFVEGEFSHVVLKRPKAGEYRIQEAYGGKSMTVEAAAADRAAAQAVLDVLETMPLYARVDMVRGTDGGLMLMELEVLEPYLFPEDGLQIGAMLGKALARRLAK